MSDSKDFIIGVVVGSVIGAAAALLLAPQSGEATRTQIAEKAGEARDKTVELAQQARDKTAEVAGQARAKATEVTEQARAKATDALHQAQGKVEEVSAQVRDRAAALGQQTQEVVDRGKQTVEGHVDALKAGLDAGKEAFQEKQSALHEEVAKDTNNTGGPALTTG